MTIAGDEKHSLVLKTAGSNRFCGKEKKKPKFDKKRWERLAPQRVLIGLWKLRSSEIGH